MLVYGDAERLEKISDIATDLERRLDAYCQLPPGLQRHGLLIDVLIGAGELTQGIADAAFHAAGQVDGASRDDACTHLLLMLADTAVRSWRSGFANGDLPGYWRSVFDRIGGEGAVGIRNPEGYAYYALYPESYVEAALASGLGRDTMVIGIRSIGTGLAAIVAAALGTSRLVTVRPKGHPFARHLELAPDLTQAILSDKTSPLAIVDEGPGLSGSSFGSVLDWLVERGVAENRLHVFPSHGGSAGNKGGPAQAKRWARAIRHHVDFHDLLIAPATPAHRLDHWVADLVGPLDGPLTDISGGGWRKLISSNESAWPPSDSQMERRKYLAGTGSGGFLVKFAGLGGHGVRKLETARRLAAAGLAPEPIGLCHGFLVQRWLEGKPLDDAQPDRERLLRGVGDYLGFRALELRAHTSGASLSALFEMAAFNIGEELGHEARDRVETSLGDSARLQTSVRPVDTDNRMHAWEWFIDDNGRLIKADGLDHSSAHDLVGCQDIAWDIAGAAVEFALTPGETAELAARVGQKAQRDVDMDLLRVLEPCYIGFQLGLWTYAAANASQENARIAELKTRYVERLQAILR